MRKSYSDLMNEITADELYEGLLAYGLFAEKLPPFLTSSPFYDYCQVITTPFSDGWRQYVYFESIRNINIPRPYGIPNPMAYQKLCWCIADNWNKLQNHFSTQTAGQDYKISRIHIRKLKKSKALFNMSYENWKTDETPEHDLLVGSRYLVKADISNCFQSIYTHAIPWALVGKNTAKTNSGKKYQNEWYNQLDHYTQNLKNGETHGLLIGPHTSNLLSELILTVIDKRLYEKGWRYIRNIDDYTCYVCSYEAGQEFLLDLGEELRSFDLNLNFKKMEILELPIAAVEQWVRRLNSLPLIIRYNKLNYNEVRYYLDSAVELMHDNDSNSAILNYAIKVLSGRKLTLNATDYYIKTISHLVLIYPYLIPLLEKYVFKKFNVSRDKIASISQNIYLTCLERHNFEAVCYAVYFALRYNFEIDQISSDTAISSNSCLFKLIAFLYFKKKKDLVSVKAMKDHAISLCGNEDDFNMNWLFTYEVLPQSKLKDDWKQMKKAGISFVKSLFLA